MFDIGFSEMILLGVIALIAIGPKQLPEVARTVARFINDVKRVTGEFTGQIMSARESANRFISETQTQIMESLESEKVVPPPNDGPLPEPEPPTPIGTHASYDPLSDAEPEQMNLDLDAAEHGYVKKGHGSSGA